MILLKLWVIILMAAILWLFLLLNWIDRNPEYADQIKNKEAPYPWFFRVWEFFVIDAIIFGIGIILYYIYEIIYILIGGF